VCRLSPRRSSIALVGRIDAAFTATRKFLEEHLAREIAA
jgi:hypothetical protein